MRLQLLAVEAEERLNHYRATTVELLALRRELTLAKAGESANPQAPAEIVRRIEGLEQWKEQVRRELLELADQMPPAAVNARNLPAAPRGNYVVILRHSLKGGSDVSLNLAVDDRRLRCVASSRPELVGMTGELTPDDDGGFRVRLKGEGFFESQRWVPADEGSFRVLEFPDRGESQVAIPVLDDRLPQPASR